MSEPWTPEEAQAIWAEVMVESDRGCVLLCAAHLDRGLEKLLRLKFQSSPGVTDADIDKVLTDYPTAALLGFGTRARVAHVLGLITKEASVALRKFAIVRNVYAHKDNAPPLTELTIQPIFDARSSKLRESMEGVVTHLAKLQEVMENTRHSKGRIALMVATLMLGMELKFMRQHAASLADSAPKVPAKPPEQS